MGIHLTLAEQVADLERKSANLEILITKVLALQSFVDDWDSGETARLPINHTAQINPVRELLEFCAANWTPKPE